MKKIITISREFGSGGHDIGMEVAKRLDIPFYDHEIVDKAVAESGFTKEFVEEHGEYSSLSSVLLGTSAPLTVIIMQRTHRIRFSRFSVESLQSLHRKVHVLSLEDVRITF